MTIKGTSLIHLVYASAAARGLSEQEILSLALEVREHNQGLGVTGMFLYAEPSFFQVLEGPRAVVEQLYAHIAEDPRHLNLTKVFEGPVGHHHFSDWSTGLAFLNDAQTGQIPGSNDFFGPGRCLQQLGASTTKDVLTGFREGAWRITPQHGVHSDPGPDIGLDLIERSRAWLDKSDLND